MIRLAEEEKKNEGETTEHKKSTAETDRNLMAAVSYLWVVSVAMYFLKKEDKYIVFHAKQGMVIFALSLVAFIPILNVFLFFVPLIALVLSIVGAVKAYKGEMYKFPFIGDLAEKIDF